MLAAFAKMQGKTWQFGCFFSFAQGVTECDMTFTGFKSQSPMMDMLPQQQMSR